MTNALGSVVGLVTIGQSPRPDVVPEMAAVIGTGVPVLLANLLPARVIAEACGG